MVICAIYNGLSYKWFEKNVNIGTTDGLFIIISAVFNAFSFKKDAFN